MGIDIFKIGNKKYLRNNKNLFHFTNRRMRKLNQNEVLIIIKKIKDNPEKVKFLKFK